MPLGGAMGMHDRSMLTNDLLFPCLNTERRASPLQNTWWLGCDGVLGGGTGDMALFAPEKKGFLNFKLD